jgi:ribonuclease R
MLKDFALSLPGGKEPSPRDYAELLKKIKDRPDAPLLQTVLLRSMKQAVYSPDNIGHFGLAYDAYTHFTSPIRRYPDLLTHRAIKAILHSTIYDPKVPWDQLGLQCSATERRADEATRDVTAWLKCYYMKDRLGETFAGTITGVTGFGIFVTLDDVYVEGLVHISEFGQDYFHFDQAKHAIIGERTKKRFQLADRVNIKVARVDIETSKIDFSLAGERLKKAVEADEKAVGSDEKFKPWNAAKKTVAKAALEKGVKAPSAPARIQPSAPRETRESREAKADKTVINVSSANPPTTPMAGFVSSPPKGKVEAKTKLPAKPAPRSKAGGALLAKKKK